MASVVIVSDDTSTMVQTLDGLEGAGLRVRWVPAQEAAPERHDPAPDAVILDADTAGLRVVEVGRAWQAVESMPLLAVMGAGDAGARAAQQLGVPFQRKPLDPAVVGPAIRRGAELRFVSALTPAAALRALGRAASGDGAQDALTVIEGSRRVDPALVREAMAPFADAYLTTDGAALEKLRERRALEVPEVGVVLPLDGTRTLRAVCARPEHIDPLGALRTVWALSSIGVVAVTREPPSDAAHPAARALGRVRRRLRARAEWLARARTYFDVLELPPGETCEPARVAAAVRQLAVWYHSGRLRALDLGDLAASADTFWEQIVKAGQILGDAPTCQRYFLHLLGHGIDLRERQMHERMVRPEAEDWLRRGHEALAAGEAFRAVSALAQAARLIPEEPDYEAFAAWARCMAEVQRGNDTHPIAVRELAAIERLLAGRRPRPRALYAMGLLAQVARDFELARACLTDALACDPNLAAARRALDRLSRPRDAAGG